MYRANALWSLVKYASSSSNPASYIVSSERGVMPSFVWTPPCFPSHNPLSHPIMEPPQGPDYVRVCQPLLQPEEKNRPYHRLEEVTPHLRIFSFLSQYPFQPIPLLKCLTQVVHPHGPVIVRGRMNLSKIIEVCHWGEWAAIRPKSSFGTLPHLLYSQPVPLLLGPLFELCGVGMAEI